MSSRHTDPARQGVLRVQADELLREDPREVLATTVEQKLHVRISQLAEANASLCQQLQDLHKEHLRVVRERDELAQSVGVIARAVKGLL